MDSLAQLRRLWDHCAWADEALFAGLGPRPDGEAARPGAARPEAAQLEAARREYAHVLAAEETWLARLEARAPTVPIWPEGLSLDELDALRRRVAAAYAAYLSRLSDNRLVETVTYANSAGTTFSTAVGDILLHVALHGQYHRGKVNLLLRQGESGPVPVDYIAFVRGAPAAVTPPPGDTGGTDRPAER